MATFKNLPNLYNLPSVAPQQAEEDPQGDMARGFKTAMMQIPQTAGGALALAGDALGADGLRDYGMGVYQKNSDKIAALSKDSDSLSNVIEGDASAADWLQYAAGYTGGQALTAVATGGLGGMIGSQLAKRGIREVVARGAQSAAAKQVAGKVAATGAKVGAGTALLGTNLMQEAGSIYPEAREEAQAQGRELDGGDLARVGLSAAGAAAVDTAMDAVMLGRMTKGGRRAGEGMARAAVREVPAAMGREAVTEGIQTGIERYGAGKELSTADAIREYVDSIGMGAVGGGLGGGASVLNTQKVQESGPLTRAANAGIDEQIKLLANDPDPLVAFPDGSVGTKTDLHMYLRQFSDPQERLEKERELMGRDPKTGKRPEPVPEPEPVMANSPEAEQQYLKAWTDAHDPVNLDYAKALIDAPGAKGKDLMIVPHPKGKGYTVVPSRWLTLDTQARAAALQKGEEAMLPSPDREMPDGRMIVDAEGGAARETYGDAARAEQGRQKLAAEAQRREELGTPVPHGTKAVPKPAKPILSPSGTPFKSKRAAINAQRAQNLGESHDIQEVEGGFVLQPKRVLEPDLIDRAAHEAATSPQNDLPEPTDAQKSANNYKMGHIKVQGLDISVENPRGSTRRGKRPDGSTWEHQMSDHYGYIKRTEGADGEQVDVYVGPKPDAERVFVVDQLNQEDGSFDEHKAMLGYGSQRAAITAYKSNFDKGWKVGPVKSMTMVEFKDWLKNGDTKQPAGETKQAETVTQSEKSETPAVVNESFTTRADANAAMLKAAEDTGRVHEVVESEDGTFAVQPVAENKDTSSEAAPAAAAQGDQRGGEQARPDDQKDNQRGAQVAQKRDAYTQDLFGIQLPDVDRVDTGSARQPAAADTGDLDSADAVPKGAKFGSRTKLVTENKRKLGAIKVVSMDDAANALAYLSRGAVERLDALVTDKDGKPLAVVGAFKGALTQASVYPATIVGEAFRVKGAANIWFAHNHPSGNEELSNADRMLYKALREVFRGSDIEPRGLFAIAGGTDATRAWQFTDGDDTYSGETSETGETTDTPVVERQYAETGLIGTPVTSPETAKKTAAEIADGKSGILMLDVKNRPIAFVPIEVAMPMRTNGRMDAIYRAISTANADAAMVVTDGSINNEGVRNLGALMRGVDVRVLDVIDTSGDVVKSWAEQGLEMAAPAFFNVNDLGKASVPSTAATFDQSLYDDIGTGKSSKDILSRIANESGNALNREIAQALLDAGINPKVTQETADGKRFTVGNAPQGYAFAAAYSPKTDTVMLFRPEEAERNTLHEMVHAGSFKALRKGGQSSVAMKQLYQHVKKSGQAGDAYGMSNFDEFTAEALSNPEFQDVLRSITAMPEGSKFRNAWNWFVDIVRRALGLPTQSANALDQALRYGRGLMLENGGDAKKDAVLGNTIEQTKTAAFRKWFGDSKVVDADGKPLVVYHGTAKDFTEFDESAIGSNFGEDSSGFFFTTDRGEAEFAADAAEEKGGSARVIEAFLSVQTPFVVDVPRDRAMRKLGSVDPSSWFDNNKDEILNAAHAADADGVIVRNDQGKQTIIVFRPEKIKSATGNNGNFDQNEPSILGNINRDTAQAISNGIKSVSMTDLPHKAGNRLKDFRGLGLQALGRRQILDIYRDDFKPEGKPSILAEYNELAQRMDADKNEAGAQADGIADRWGKLKDERELAELMHDATLAQIDPEKDYQTGDNRGQWTGLRNRYNALSADAKVIYKEARNAYTDHWLKVRAEIKDRIQRSMPESPRRAKMLERMDDEFFKKIKGVYFPLARFGDYLVTVKGADGKTESVNFAETLNEAEKLRAELVKKFPKDQGHVVGKVQKRREFNAARDAVGRGFLQELFGLLDQSGVADELQDSINQLYLSSLPDLSWAKHGIHRKGTPGFSQDARRAFAQNMFHGARYLAKLKYADQMADKLTDMQDFVDSKVEDESFDSVAAQQVVDEMTKRHDAYMNPKTNPLSTTLTSLGFVFYLGLSPASAIVNLSQTPLVTLPMLAAKYGYGKASAALLAASKQAAGNRNDISKALNGDELRAFNEAVKSGVIDVSMAHDLAGIASGDDTKTHAKLRPVMKWASYLFHHGEKFNRQATMMAAYRLAREAGQDHDAAYASAVQVTYDSHFDYSAGNRPRMMQGDVARVVLLFKQYAQNMVYTLSRNAMLAANGDKEARKVISGLLLSHGMAAGVLGLPAVGTLLSIASALGSDEDEPWDAKVALRNALADAIGEKPAEVLVHGLSRLTPFDISGRVGLDKLILPDVQEGLEGARAAESWMSAMLGPIAGIGINTAKGLRHIAEGDYSRGMESILPSALRGPVKAIRYAGEGVKDKTGIVITEDTTALEELGQALGFSPSRVREANEGKSAVYQADRRLLDRRQALMTQWAHARMAGDNEGTAEVAEAILKFNEKNPTRRITPVNLNQSLRNRQRRIDQAENGVYLPSKRRDVRDVGRFAADQ